MQSLKTLTKCFLCATPINQIRDILDFEEIFKEITWEEQQDFWKNTVDNEIVLEYPLKVGYQKSFIKFIVDELIRLDVEVSDTAYDALGRLMSLPELGGAGGKLAHRHFEFENGVVSVREKGCFVSEGSTGLCVWQVRLMLEIIPNK